MRPTDVILRYQSEQGNNPWVWRELRDHGSVTLSRVFNFKRGDLLAEPDQAGEQDGFEDFEALEDFEYEFRFASRDGGYFHIDGRIFDIPNTVLIADQGLPLERKVFVAERNISIFRRIAGLIKPDQPIIIGGGREEAIPIEDFRALLRTFPNTTELDRYAAARVATVIGDYLVPLKDARDRYEAYLNRRRSTLKDQPLRQPELLQTEIEKYVLIRETILEWLKEADNRSEEDWQKMILNFLLLIFPKYVAVLEKVKIPDAYSAGRATRNRYIDLVLIDVSGNVDIIEIKKPFENALLRRTKYRDNSIPAKELAGSVMQAEKYLFHLSKWDSPVRRRSLTGMPQSCPRIWRFISRTPRP